jgi:hypothetical protein
MNFFDLFATGHLHATCCTCMSFKVGMRFFARITVDVCIYTYHCNRCCKDMHIIRFY